MKTQSLYNFYYKLHNKKRHYPFNGQIELTYRCNFDCIHCYCKGSENKEKELTTSEFKKILDEIHKEGCVWLTLTGGEPLVRRDFREIYAYAKSKGFILTLFTNGYGFSEKDINFIAEQAPYSIQVTLNGVTKKTYERVTGINGSLLKIRKNIDLMIKKNLPVILKANCLKENSHEIGKLKTFTENILGKPNGNKYNFRYGSMIYPRLDNNVSPVQHRLSFEQLMGVRKQDADIWEEYQKCLNSELPYVRRKREFLYHCNTWMNQFYINPFGRLKFCVFSDKFSVDLKKASFRYGFYEVFPRLLKEKFQTDSECRDCTMRPICHYCPARAYLETGNEESPVAYYCELAKNTIKLLGCKEKSRVD